jgi:hypothetical protein
MLQGAAFSDAGVESRGYAGIWLGTEAKPFAAPGTQSVRRAGFQYLIKDEVLPSRVTVVAGTPCIIGSVTDHDGVSTPVGAVLTVTKPDGTKLNTATAPNDPTMTVELDAHGNLISFVIPNPQAGDWTVQVAESPNESPDFQVFVATVPQFRANAPDYQEADAVLQRTFGPKFRAEDEAELLAAVDLASWGCFWCQVGVWVFAVALAIAIVVLGAMIPATAPAVMALAGWLDIAATAALTVVKAGMAVGGLTVNALVTHICGWTGTCS